MTPPARTGNNATMVAVLSAIGVVLFFTACLFFGSVDIPFGKVLRILAGGESGRPTWDYIVLQSRLPQAVTALFTGAALAVAGLMLQTMFNNPLAGPSLLGISTGAGLGVAVVMLFTGGIVGGSAVGFTLTGSLAVVAGAFAGSALVLGIIIFFSTIVRSNIMLLIIGLMVGYLASSVISLLNFFASAEGVFTYTIWGMGDFSSVSVRELPFFCICISVGLAVALLLMKPMNALLLGERYAGNLGVRVKGIRFWMLAGTGLLTAVATAFCGPISFIGLAVPHIARLLTRSSNHSILMPITIMMGGIIALACNLVSMLPGSGGVIPLNAITPVLGAPVIIYVIVNQKHIRYFQ